MLNTRTVNNWLRSSYTVEQIALWPKAAIITLEALARGIEPPKASK